MSVVPTFDADVPRVVTTSNEPGDTLASLPLTKAAPMPASLRRAVRLTVLTPSTQVDLEVTDDAPPAEIVRLVMQDPRAHVGDSGAGAVLGWDLIHPRLGALPADIPIGEVGGHIDHGGALVDGDTLVLREREPASAGAPVDDVAEQTRVVGGEAERLARLVAAVFAVLLGPTAALVLALSGRDPIVTATSGLVAALGVPFVLRGQPRAAGAAAVAAVPAAALASALLMPGHGSLVVAGLALGGASAAAVVGLLTATGRWWRPLALALGCIGSLVAVQAVGRHMVGWHASALTVVAVAVLLAASTGLSLRTSGLAVLDDRVTVGEDVSEAEVTAAVQRASDDLAAVLFVIGGAVVVLAGPLGGRPGAASALALAVALLVSARARLMLRACHVVPLVVGGGLATARLLVMAIAGENERAVPLLVGALVVVAVLGATSAPGAVSSVAAGRMRRATEIGEKVLVMTVPLLLTGVFDLYRIVWDRF